jgi:hypothetical protein
MKRGPNSFNFPAKKSKTQNNNVVNMNVNVNNTVLRSVWRNIARQAATKAPGYRNWLPIFGTQRPQTINSVPTENVIGQHLARMGNAARQFSRTRNKTLNR